ncbi:acyltransferase family protein [Pontibacter beigongshangensis]|uniref:acyltransferase family protein n=1 Tax=Pontibacter beigongshangensis TaxID=2574733 RepID=UPI0016500CAA|nr:acyltransferase [Pontibacter beigongshangensis]
MDSLRGIAAFLVVLYHYTTTYRSLYGHNFSRQFDFAYGNYGVELFFMISGFVIFFSFKNITDGKDFLFKRITRLYPAYWFCAIVTFAAVQFFGLPGLETSFTDFLINLTMFQKLVGVPEVDGVYWTLFYEWMFYLMLLVIFVTRKLDKILYIGAVWMALNFVNMHLYEIPFASKLLNLYYGAFFYSGILFYLLKFKPEVRKHVQVQLAIVAAMALSFYIEKGLTDVLIIGGMYLVFFLSISGKLDFMSNRVFLFLGSISYPLYLFHQYIGYIIINNIKDYFGSSVLVIVPPIVFSIICAYLISVYVEQPVMQRMKNWYKARAGNKPAQESKQVVTSAFAQPKPEKPERFKIGSVSRSEL